MSSYLERMQAKAAERETHPRSRVASLFRSCGVSDSSELKRILSLPRRPAAPSFPEEFAELLRRPGGSMILKPLQAWALWEIAMRQGGATPIAVGGGKTLISFLASAVVDAKRPVLVAPAALREKTLRDFADLRKHWICPNEPTFVSYSELGLEHNANRLRELAPDLIIADEGHKLKNPRAAVTKRVRRYLEESALDANERPQAPCRFVVLSGTLTTKGLGEFAHLFDWALEAASPLPRNFGPLSEWALAADAETPNRYAPGALMQLMNDEERSLCLTDEVEAVRQAIQRRIVETPGVIATQGREEISASLSIEVRLLDAPRPEIDAAFQELEDYWRTPDGWEISLATRKAAHAIELANGFYYVWDPRPPQEWTDARRDWSRACRHVERYNQRELDSELQVWNAVKHGHYDGKSTPDGIDIRKSWEAWNAIEPTFEPNQMPVWVDSAALEATLEGDSAIIWVDHVAVGERLSERLGLPYYHQKGRDALGRFIDDADPREGSIVASIGSNREGRNLQHRWNRMIFMPCSLHAGTWEQAIGRMHRYGQKADTVEVVILMACAAQYKALLKSREKARYIQSTTGVDQKLCYADWIDPIASGKTPTGPRWVGL